ncbi:MAG: DUF4406 domain-containing protein [Patescibacteria group bacterium]|nr:DUF4406 domain-containing protein [Patescibacteria group bacterium]
MPNSLELPRYWTPFDIFDLRRARSFESLFKVAHSVLLRMPQPVSMVCGPITSGGRGGRVENIKIFKKTIDELSAKNIEVFSQMPFERPIWKIQRISYCEGGYNVLDSFYLPIFESGLIKAFYFIRGWESSFGAKWEHGQAKRLKIKIVYL